MLFLINQSKAMMELYSAKFKDVNQPECATYLTQSVSKSRFGFSSTPRA